MKKTVFLVFSILFFIIFSTFCLAETTYGSTWEETCNNGICTRTFYSGVIYTQNATGHWVRPSDVLYITKNSDDITFHYDGTNYYNVTFEVGAVYNGNYYPMADVKELKPNINFDFPSEKHDTYIKYAINISNLTDNLNVSLINSITLTYKNHYGFTLEQLKQGNRCFYVKDKMALYFEDLLEFYTISLNKSEKRIYIGNLTENVKNGNLYLDPALQLQDADSENLEDTYINQTNPTSNYSSSDILYLRPLNSTFSNKTYTYLKFNISSIPAGKTITEAKLELKMTIPSITGTPKQQLRHVYNQTWTEDTITWNNHPCDENMTNSGECNQTAEASTTYYGISSTSKNFTITNMVKKDYDDSNSNFSVIINVSCNDNPAGKDYYFLSKEYSTVSYRPTLYVTYTSGYPKWYSNQTSVPS